MKSSWIRFFLYFIVMIGLTGCDKKEEFLKGKTEATDTVEYEKEINPAEEVIKEADPMEPYYGAYKVIDFYPGDAWVDGYREGMPWEEADMMIGKVILIEPDYFVTYDPDRLRETGVFGLRRGTYELHKHVIENPDYKVVGAHSEENEEYIYDDIELKNYWASDGGKKFINKISFMKDLDFQYFYTLDDRNEMLLTSVHTYNYFVLAKMDEKPLIQAPKELSEEEKKQILEMMYGTYRITEFIPTKYYPALDRIAGDYILPLKEAEMMIGKEIVITEEKYQGYDNDRTPNSEIRKRGLTDYRLEKVSIEEPMCQVNSVRREEVYGLRDNMLPDELVQEEYVEVKTTKYYEIYYEKYMKFYLLDNWQVLMLCMNEYFLMEKADERQTVTQKEEGTEAEIETRTIENTGKIQDQEELMEPYYGYYEISMGLGWDKINKRIFEKIPLQEVDLLTGKIITIQKELFETYNNDRKEGSIRMMRNEYEIYKDTVINPVYEVKDRKSEALFEIFAGKDLGISTCIGDTIFQNITKVIRIPNSKNTQSLYALEGSVEMILYLTDTDMCFLLKKIEKKPEIKIADLLKEEEEVQILEEFYGNYRVTGFLPTLYFPSMDVLVFEDCAKLPEEEAEMMIGKEIILTEVLYRGYDNYRAPSSFAVGRWVNDYWLKEAIIENPEYQVSIQLRKDIYGLRDDMLPDRLLQEQYIEIKTKKSYGDYTQRFPKFYVLENGNIIMLCMNEYFLLEKK